MGVHVVFFFSEFLSVFDACPPKLPESSARLFALHLKSKRDYSSSSSFSHPAHKAANWILWEQENSLLFPNLCDYDNQAQSSIYDTSEFLFWKEALHPVPANLLSLRLGPKSMGQEGRAVTETSTMLWSPFSPLLQVAVKTFSEQAMSPSYMHSEKSWAMNPRPVHSCVLNSGSIWGSFT